MEFKNLAEETVKSAVRENEDASPEQEFNKASLKKRLIKEKKADLSENARVVLTKRYLKKDEQGNPVETPEDMFFRVAENIASAEKLYDSNADCGTWTERFYNIMTDMEFLPNSPTLMNAGRELQQLSACFVLEVGDSMEEIFESVKHTALIHKSGGGTGFSFSSIRPKNDIVKSTKGISSGPISFMQVFDTATETVKQGGTRRGANMGILRCDHPEIMDFIEMKAVDGKLSNFNISVGITDEFMEALKKDEDYPLVNPRTGEVITHIKASKVFSRIVELAWENGEPGIVFLDRMNADNPTPNAGKIESTNPCGEQPLLPYESCNLGSINLMEMVCKDEKGNTVIDYNKLGNTISTAVRFLDNVIDMNSYPLKKIDETTKANRKIGLGIMGFADVLIAMGISYSSHTAASLAEELMGFIQKESMKVSAFLGQNRGEFPNYKGSIYDKENNSTPYRNATTTTIAPTGTISMIAGCSSGIEPLFSIAYEKNVLDGEHLLEVNPQFEKIAKNEGFYSKELMEMISKTGTISNIPGIPKRIKEVFQTSHDISPRWHITIQGAFQKYTHNAVSKTVNFPFEAKTMDVEDVYRYAYQLNCKGVTVYRNGSRENQVITTGKGGSKFRFRPNKPARISPRERPEITKGHTYKTKTGCGNLYVNINYDEQGICEIFTQMGKSGGCAASNAEAVARTLSIALRAGLDPKDLIAQLKGIRCPSPTWYNGEMILSCADAIGRVLEKAVSDIEEADQLAYTGTSQKRNSHSYNNITSSPGSSLSTPCPECGGIMEHEGGCAVCKSCGFSKCG